ncbi:DNA-binding protein [Alkalicoccobacillus porphyridii]|uniref:DNA-binding protein n=1 Tax=Alkalicoccobacillus porphyridii TaxID=2597270 RepID=A0A554A0R4_9BACI|nr:DNA-binding protein [Alkalicoccobacillus porphyridii]TSB47284.1 DNA-binding protein [Alkalicoccobacillus porphyridii]
MDITLGLIALGGGVAIGGYFIGDGLKNFKNPSASSNHTEELEDWGQPKLIKQKDVHHHLGISKEDAHSLIKDYPTIPHLTINDQIYYPTKKLKKWANTLSEEQ